MSRFHRLVLSTACPSWRTLAAAASLSIVGCSGGATVAGGPDGGPDVEFAVRSTSVVGGSVVKLNRSIVVEFTEDIDFSTVSHSTVQIVDSEGLPAMGTFALIGPRTLRFQPRCPTNEDDSNGGFGQGRSYRLTIAAQSHSGIGGGMTVRNTAGEGIVSGVNIPFTTPASSDALVLFADAALGPPQVRILDEGEEAPVSNAGANYSYVEFGGDPEDVDYFRFDSADDRGEIATEVPLNLYSDASKRFAVVLGFNQSVDSSAENVNSEMIRLEYYNQASGQWLRLASSVTLLENCSAAGASVRIQPTGIVPQSSTLRVSLRDGFRDLVGERIVATQSRFAQFESGAANPDGPSGQQGEGSDEVLERFTVGGGALGSLEDTSVLSPLPRANWGTSASPGALSASFAFDGTGGAGGNFDVTVPSGQILFVNTDYDEISGGPGVSTSSVQPVLGGRMDVRNLTVERDARLVFLGSNTATILATGEVRVDGLISVNGGSNFGVSTLATASFPEQGAAGQAGGGDGGDASMFTAESTPRGGAGQGAFGAPGFGGQGGESAYAPDDLCATERRRAAGGGGGRLGGDVRYDVDGTFALPPALCQTFVGMDAEPGFLGSFEGLGAVSQTTFARGGAVAPGPFVDDSSANDFFGTLTTASGEQIRGELTSVWAGSGGGGGGDAVTSATFPLTPFTVSGDEKGSGGGGGAGGLLILSIGDIVIESNGSVTANGGHGGGGENRNLRDRIGGGSGGGSGGHIVMSSAGSIIIEAEALGDSVGEFYRDDTGAITHEVRPLSALGGQGGCGRQDRCGANGNGATGWRADAIPVEAFEGRSDVPPNVLPLAPTFDWCNRVPGSAACAGTEAAPEGTVFGGGGDGGPGIIQLHVSDPDTQLVLGAAGATGYASSGLDITRFTAPPVVGWRPQAERPDVLVPFFGSTSESFSRWIPLGLARQNPDGSSNPVEFVFEGTDETGSVRRAGGAGAELAPVVPSTVLSLGGSAPSIDSAAGVLRVPAASLLDPHGLYARNAMLLAEFAVRFWDSDAPLNRTEFTVVSAALDAASAEYVLALDPRGASLNTELLELEAGLGDLQFEVVPFFFRLSSGGIQDTFPLGTDVKILFDATLQDPLTGEPSSDAGAAYSGRLDPSAGSADIANGFTGNIDALNGQVAAVGSSDPSNVQLESVDWDFVRFKVEFDLATGSSELQIGGARPGLDFLRLAYRF